ncbi:MAG: hypothetical protein ACJ8AG_16865 [Ktedonobacteraceae bacterium]
MEQIPFDDPQDATIADNILQHLRRSLQLLASPTQVQLSHFPAGWVVLTDEMVLDFDAWVERISSYWKLSQEQMARLTELDQFLNKMSDPSHSDFWSDEALSSDPRWEEVRTLAQVALVACGWPIEIPPPAREEQGMLVDNGSTFIKSRLPS